MSGTTFAVFVFVLAALHGDALSFFGLFNGGAVLQQDVEVAVYGTSHARKVVKGAAANHRIVSLTV